jgi:hypothetical protein
MLMIWTQKIEVSSRLHLPELGTARSLTNTNDTTTTLDENRANLRSYRCFVMAGGVWSTLCDHGLQDGKKQADFCENQENRSGPISLVCLIPASWN